MADPKAREGHVWEAGWEGHAEAQRARIARLTLQEKLRWLEEAQAIIRHMHRRPATGTKRGAGPATP
ncbi:MAG TPA: hypothetical protein VJY35_11295 [Candidatus Eisenbacteria bacterium]|nr:hypothetical protein [Candidatus Eisenbacteria bacterium]